MKALTHYLAAQAELHQRELLEDARRQRMAASVRRDEPIRIFLRRLPLPWRR